MGRHFDALCRFLEREEDPVIRSYWLPKIRTAALFEIKSEEEEQRLQEIGRQCATKDIPARWFLPFPVVALESPASVELVYDAAESADNSLRKRWDAAKALYPRVGVLGLSDGYRAYPPFRFRFGMGLSIDPPGSDRFRMHLSDFHGVYFENGTWVENTEGSMTTAAQMSGTLLGNAIFAINAPNRFVVERTARRPPCQGNAVSRSHERSTYTTLTLGEVRKQLGLAHQESVLPKSDTAESVKHAPAAHWRRAHLHTYRSDKWQPELRGKSVVYPATWVGPREALVSGRVYRVLVDLPGAAR